MDIIKKIKTLYGIDLDTNKDIIINGITIPNYSLQEINTYLSNDERKGMFYRVIDKTFGYPPLSYYETTLAKIEPDDVVFDCGASTGIFSLYAANKAQLVYSFEIIKELQKYLYNSKKYNDKIKVIPFGLNDKKYMGLITLDDFYFNTGVKPDFIKINVEGNEMEVVKGGLKMIEITRPKIAISIHHFNPEEVEKRINTIKDWLPNYTFSVNKNINYDPVLICHPKGVENE